MEWERLANAWSLYTRRAARQRLLLPVSSRRSLGQRGCWRCYFVLLFFPKTTEEAVYPVTAERVCDA